MMPEAQANNEQRRARRQRATAKIAIGSSASPRKNMPKKTSRRSTKRCDQRLDQQQLRQKLPDADAGQQQPDAEIDRVGCLPGENHRLAEQRQRRGQQRQRQLRAEAEQSGSAPAAGSTRCLAGASRRA